MKPAISKVWTFASSSGGKTYETLLYNDFSTSCDCPGWTRRVADDGTRSCRHTRLVHLGQADEEALRSHDYFLTPLHQRPQADPKPAPHFSGTRKLAL